MSLVVPLLLLLAVAPLVIALLRANELFVVRFDGERLRVVRGRIPQGLVNELADVLRPPGAPSGGRVVTLRGVSEDARVRLYPQGELTEAEKQRLRNVIASWPVVRVRNG
ncbi:MAG TPA: DUF3634 family protein [Minicystis sp.]|nr:DUF3634 family protein [Minicystis sp.]